MGAQALDRDGLSAILPTDPDTPVASAARRLGAAHLESAGLVDVDRRFAQKRGMAMAAQNARGPRNL